MSKKRKSSRSEKDFKIREFREQFHSGIITAKEFGAQRAAVEREAYKK